jgi:anionic cell wall polymer biosynthesis LytR-Cps2A-Psr (LCP) family protein
MNLDLDIEDYVTVDFSAIADGIDMLGGIDIEITEEELKELNYHLVGTAMAIGRESPFVQHAGMVHLNGMQATTYARIRSTAGGDFTRTERQRLVIEKVVEKVKKTDLQTLDAMINELFSHVSTSFTLPEILMYATAYKEYTLGENTGFPYSDLLSTDTVSGYGSIVIPGSLTGNVSRMHEFLFGTVDYTPSSEVQSISSEITAKVRSARGY